MNVQTPTQLADRDLDARQARMNAEHRRAIQAKAAELRADDEALANVIGAAMLADPVGWSEAIRSAANAQPLLLMLKAEAALAEAARDEA